MDSSELVRTALINARILLANNQLGEAAVLLSQILRSDKNNAPALFLLGTVRSKQKKIRESINLFNAAIKSDPSFHVAHVSLFFAYQLIGESEKSWREFEYRFHVYEQAKKCLETFGKEKAWQGERISGKRLLVYCEQGNGDMIHFARFLPMLEDRHQCKVILRTPDELVEIFKQNNLCSEYCGKDTPEFDYHCSIISLPLRLGLKETNGKRYLQTSTSIDLSQYKDKYKIGIAWSGSPLHPMDRQRSIHLSAFKEIHDIPGVKLFSLQKDLRSREYSDEKQEIKLSDGCADMGVVDMSEMMTDYNKTAAIIQSLDLLITVDTSILHLAGALGQEAWGLIPYLPDWRWRLHGESTELYSSVRLFRQTNSRDWNAAFIKAKEELCVKVGNGQA